VSERESDLQSLNAFPIECTAGGGLYSRTLERLILSLPGHYLVP